MRYAVMLFLVALLTGCSNYPTSLVRIEKSSKNVVLGDSILEKTLKFGHVESRTHNGGLIVELIVTNKIMDDQHIEHRFDWYDAQGLELDKDNSPWRHVIIFADSTVTLKGKANSLNAKSFRVSVRNAP